MTSFPLSIGKQRWTRGHRQYDMNYRHIQQTPRRNITTGRSNNRWYHSETNSTNDGSWGIPVGELRRYFLLAVVNRCGCPFIIIKVSRMMVVVGRYGTRMVRKKGREDRSCWIRRLHHEP